MNRTMSEDPECVWAFDNLGAHLDRELSGDETMRIHAHRKTCADCQNQFELLRRLSADIRHLPASSPALGARIRLRARIEAERDVHRSSVTIYEGGGIKQVNRSPASAFLLPAAGDSQRAFITEYECIKLASGRTELRMMYRTY